LLCLVIAPAAADLCDDGSLSTSQANLADLVTARGVALGIAPVSACPGLNSNNDQSVTVSEIVGGISLVLQGNGNADSGSAAGLPLPVVIDVGTAWGSAGEEVTFDVRLTSSLGLVAGAQIDINFDSQTPIPPHENPIFSGAPFCDVNAAINKNQSAFAYQGPNGVRGIIISFTNVDLIPEGAVLFTCHVQISPLAPTGTYPLPCSNAQSSTALGVPLPTTCAPGAVEVIEHTNIDHYKCYQGSDLKTPKFVKQALTTTDQLTTDDPNLVLNLKFVCAPVDKNGEGINDPAAHLACYGLKAQPLDQEPKLLVSTQFQMTQFQANKPKLLCVPATKTLMP
jgi:hypothetical protein